MADNITIKDGAGSNVTIRSIDYAGVYSNVHELAVGGALVATGNRLPVTLGLTNTELRASPITVSLATSGAAYDSVGNALIFTASQKKFRDSFVGSSLNSTKWDSVTGTGGTITVSGGTLTLGSGTTIASETSVTTKDIFTVPFKIGIGITLSQRIANQTFFIEAISVDPVTGTPDGQHTYGIFFDATTATQGRYRVQNSGATPLDSSAVTFPTTASGSMYEIEANVDEAWFHGGTLDATTGRINSYRRHQQIPDPNAVFKIRLRWLNGGSAPASNTNAVVQYLTVYDHTEIPVEIAGSRGMSVAAQASAVQITNTAVPVSGTITANIGTGALAAGTNLIGDVGLQVRTTGTGGVTAHHFVAAGSTNQANIKASTGRVYGWCLANTTASWRYLKFHNTAGTPTAGAGVVLTVGIPPNGIAQLFLPQGINFATGIARTCVTGAADTDATAVTANDVVGDIFFA